MSDSDSARAVPAPALEYDVIIVGAGLVGAAMACALAFTEGQVGAAPLRIAVLDAGAEPARFSGCEFDPRVVALTRASEQLLDSVGAWTQICAERACAYTDMEVWDAAGTGHIHFDCREVQQRNLGHIVESSVVTRALLERLGQNPAVSLLRPARVLELQRDDEQGLSQLQLDDDRRLVAPLVLAADGANSKLRQLAGIPTREWDYGQRAIVTTVRTSESHGYTAWQRFLDSGPLAFLPLQVALDDGLCSHYSSIVWSVTPELAGELMQLSDARFQQRLGAAFEQRLGEVTAVARRFDFPLRQRHATEYIGPGLALLGDAAHTIHPLAGQGANLGLLDVAALRDEILRAQSRQLPLSEPSILKRYQRNRRGHNLGMMALMEAFKRLFGADQLPVRWARNEGMRTLNSLPLLKNAVVKQAMGL
ncbi:MAG: UbiH/UbiF/VisC/COQ6 family ubiquinone biosynthesis hydroxylase [Gammaproteobacteria bacterium]|uniref:UbiH/UbiF/VisC/COQ6 family ubiquinone biosynthesis hydroxylase n=1 Tax=Pseudomaricurvus alcaniphilus TaxID=1166482 RepID=UPI0014091EE1|nr:UbiH/UbiF/VisC/COQ6 family ubiquinone biosynthesis hydroxylase [Pseudomaricurvus alcaniphilus]MBR9912896.1 UbiH/UbiF/VisC/COQ6 family ubiquinone biosynthesis hydroxylase [Gammaproteobacteria bacterium]NHN38696.1 UbiH/UbiF/VisC/COQ6 family ubiquinone biosynthesis hydroxylase [Pseudomaricurvus alcaniphilus]